MNGRSAKTKAITERLDQLFSFADAAMPGFSVGIARESQVLYRKGFGMASLEHGTPNVPGTRMRIGSTTKHFACLCALLLAEEGKLDIDAGIRHFLPDIPVPAGEPTLRNLMTHTGGLRCHLDLAFLSDGLAIKGEGACLELLARQRTANFAPGDRIVYNNAGYHMLSRVIERVSGQPLRTFMRERLFVPLGMHDTELLQSDLDIVKGMATLHVSLPTGGFRRGIFPSEEILGEGGIVSTVDDMLTWAAHLRNPTVIGSADSWREMLRQTVLNNGFRSDYSLGLMRFSYRGIETICHAGGVFGGGCQMLTIPDKAIDIVVLTNTSAVQPAELTFKIIDRLLEEEGCLATEPVGPKATNYPWLVGRRFHSRETGLLLRFEEKEGVLAGSAYNCPAFPLSDKGDALVLDFHHLANGPFAVPKVPTPGDGLTVVAAGTPTTLEFVEPLTDPEAIAVAGDSILGHYVSSELPAKAVVVRHGDELRLRMKGDYGRSEQVLEPFTNGLFGFKSTHVEIPIAGLVETVRDDSRVCALLLSTDRTNRLRLDRVRASDR